MHIDEGNGPIVALLKSPDFGQDGGSDGELPYRIDHLRAASLRLGWSDLHLRRARRSAIQRIESAIAPFDQAWLTRRLRARSVATLAMFESEGHGLAAWRRITGRHDPRLVIVACWLADLAVDGGAVRRGVYRWLYRSVDQVVVFSSNQVAVLEQLLGIPATKVAVVRFGVDLDELADRSVGDTGSVVAVGRDLGRDWPTLLRAVAGTGWSVDLLTRRSQVQGLTLPSEVRMLGRLPRAGYLDLLCDATVVVIPTEVREYPTGQTVLLEAMALGKACVVTDTPAMREYVDDGVTALLVPPHDPVALRRAVQRLLDDPSLRSRLGAGARRCELEHGGARAMWHQIAGLLIQHEPGPPTE